jgi:hypothetical protein
MPGLTFVTSAAPTPSTSVLFEALTAVALSGMPLSADIPTAEADNDSIVGSITGSKASQEQLAGNTPFNLWELYVTWVTSR